MKKYRLEIPRHKLKHVLSVTKIKTIEDPGAYVLFHFKDQDTEFIIYDNTKNKPYKAIFEGSLLPKDLTPFIIEEIGHSNTQISSKIKDIPQIGSDEVGFGDFFGPLVVVSAYIDQDILTKIENYQITDSKKLNDTLILMMGSELIKIIPHMKNIVNNPKYNEVNKSGRNMNEMKAMLHHNVLTKLARKMAYTGNLYIDKFTSDQSYFKATKTMDDAPIILVPHGEISSVSIAAASIIARYYFLLEMKKIGDHFGVTIPFGAGKNVDIFAKEFLIKHGKSNLESITKHNFRNFKDLFED